MIAGVGKVYRGENEVKKIYLGEKLVYSSGIIFDPDAKLYIDALIANGFNNQTINIAWNTAVVKMKADGVWDKIKVLYPYRGALAATTAINAKNPAAFNQDWFGGVTHNAIGVKGNAINAYGATGFIPSVEFSSSNIGITTYVYSNDETLDNRVLFGNLSSPGANTNIFHLLILSGGSSTRLLSNGFFNSNVIDASELTHLRIGNNVYKIKDGVSSLLTSSSTAGSPLSTEFYTLAGNLAGSAMNFSESPIAYEAVTEGFTLTDATNFYNAMRQFLTDIGL